MSKKVVVGILNPGNSPADNGRTIHALKLAAGLIAGGAEVKVVFHGEGVRWLDRFANRNEESHPFIKHYGYAFDAVREHVVTCNMCCHRFEELDAVEAAGIPVLGEPREHVDVARWVLDGFTVINH